MTARKQLKEAPCYAHPEFRGCSRIGVFGGAAVITGGGEKKPPFGFVLSLFL